MNIIESALHDVSISEMLARGTAILFSLLEGRELQKESGFIQQLQKAIAFQLQSEMSKNIVLKLDLNCEKNKRRAMKTLAGIDGVDSINIDAKDGNITVTGTADPVCLTTSLRKYGFAELVSVKPFEDSEKESSEEKESSKENSSYVILPRSCDRFSGQNYYWSYGNFYD